MKKSIRRDWYQLIPPTEERDKTWPTCLQVFDFDALLYLDEEVLNQLIEDLQEVKSWL